MATPGRSVAMYSELQNSRIKVSLPLPSVLKKSFSIVEGPPSSAVANPGRFRKGFNIFSFSECNFFFSCWWNCLLDCMHHISRACFHASEKYMQNFTKRLVNWWIYGMCLNESFSTFILGGRPRMDARFVWDYSSCDNIYFTLCFVVCHFCCKMTFWSIFCITASLMPVTLV